MINLDPILVVGAAIILFLIGYLCGEYDENVRGQKARMSARADSNVIEF